MKRFSVHPEAFLSAPIESVFEVISDLRTYAKWWLLVHVVPLDSHKLVAGTRWRFQSGRPGRRPISWIAEVLEVESPRRIEMEYVERDLLGRTAWELEACEGRTRVAYVYRGVSGVHPQTAATFARYGTQLHSLAMQTDALANLGRYLGGEILGEERRAEVEAVVQAGVAGLN